MGSAREDMAAREYRAFMREEAEKQRLAEDRAEHEKYVAEIEREQRGCAPAEKIQPLSFEEWRKFIPAELQNAPAAVRGAAASTKSTMTRLLTVAFDRIKTGELSDDELAVLGFDPEDRVFIPEAQLSIPMIVDIFNRFAQREPRYVRKLHYKAITDFLSRNNLVPSEKHVALAFNHLLGVSAIAAPEPEPEPERPESVYVNLQIESDPELERLRRWVQYENDIVVTDPATGQGYTQFMLDRVDSETYRRLMRIPRISEYRPEPQR